MKTIFILCDTLNRRMLEQYATDNDVAFMPNFKRLAERSVVFNNHWCGSAPCMPARRDILTGRLNFLEKPWGAMEPFDFSLPTLLAKHANVHSQMFSDHSHYLIPGGENYTKGFTAFDVFRGQEGDPWKVRPDAGGIRKECRPEGFKGVYSESERANRESFRTEEDYPSVRTIRHAIDWLDSNHQADNFFLWLECFDPHEPYDTPRHYLDLYESEDDYSGPDFTHPDYQKNVFTPEETRHLRNRCKAIMTMTDRHLGELFDCMTAHDLWKDTMVILTTDHGFHLGEHGYMAKNYMAPYNEVFHIPLFVYAPGVEPGRCEALTQNIDVFSTILENYGIAAHDVVPYPIHGKSLWPLFRGEKETLRDGIIYGYFGKQVAYTDGEHTYFHAAKDESNRPLYVYTAMPTVLRQVYGADDGLAVTDYSKIEMGRFLSWTEYPVYRFPADIVSFANPSQEFSKRSIYNQECLLFDIKDDYTQQNQLKNSSMLVEYQKKLRVCMEEHQAPEEQYERLGL